MVLQDQQPQRRSFSQFSQDEQAKAADAMRSAKDQNELLTVIKGFGLPDSESADLWDMAMVERSSPAVTPQDSFVTQAAKGLWRNSNPLALASTLQQTYQNPGAVAKGIWDGVSSNLAQAGKDIGAGNYGEATESVIKAIPIVGGSLGSMIDNVRSGRPGEAVGEGIALFGPSVGLRRGAVGTLRGVAKIGTRFPSVATTAENIAGRLEGGAERRVVEVLSPHTGPNKRNFANSVRKQSDTLLKRGDVDALTPGAAYRGIEAKFEKASDAWDDAASRIDNTKPVSLPDIIDRLQTKIDEMTLKSKRGAGGWDQDATGYADQIAFLKGVQQKLGGLGSFTDYKTLMTERQSLDQIAKPIYHPSTTSDFFKKNAEASAASKAAGVLRDTLATENPEMAAANAEFHIYRSMMDVARAVAETETTRPNVFRKLTTQALGLIEGYRQGGAGGAALGMVGAASVEAATSAGATTKLKTAQLFSDLATALRGGSKRKIEKSMFDLGKMGVKYGAQAAILNDNDRARQAAGTAYAPASPASMQMYDGEYEVGPDGALVPVRK